MLILGVLLLLILFLFIGIPIVFALIASGVIAVVILGDAPLTYSFSRLYLSIDNYALVALPLFIFTGSLMNRGGVSKNLIDLAGAIVGPIKGGLAMITIIASALFGSISGTATGTSAAIGSIMIPSMKEKKYDPAFAAAVTSASSSLGIVIPPSLPLILYGSISGLSVGMLFVAALPIGIFIILVYMFVTYFIAKRYNLPKALPRWDIKYFFGKLIKALPALTLPVCILGSIMTGVATPTEAAGLAVVLSLIIGKFVYKKLDMQNILLSLRDALISNAVVMIIIAGGGLLGWCLAYLRAADSLMQLLMQYSTSAIGLMLFSSLILFIAGFIFDGTVMVVIIVPLFLPLVKTAEIDPLLFAMVVLICWCIGQQTPPVASGLYVTTAIAGVEMTETVKYLVYYIFALVVILFSIMFFPDITLYFSKLLSGYEG